MAAQALKHGSTLPWYSTPFLVGMLSLSLLDHLWQARQPVTHASWASHLTILINLGIICNPLSWGAASTTCKTLGAPGGDGSSGWANFALGLLLASHGLCLAYQGLGRRLSGFWPQVAQQVLLVVLAAQNNASMCSQLQLDYPAVRELMQGVAAHLQALALLPAAALLDVPWVKSLPLRAQCQAVLLFWQLSLGIVLPLSLQLRRCQIISQRGATATPAMPGMGQLGGQPDAGIHTTSRLLGGTSGGNGSGGHGLNSSSWGSRIFSMMCRSHMGPEPGAGDSRSGTGRQQAQRSSIVGARQSLLRSSTLNPQVLLSVAVQLVAVAWLVAAAVTSHTLREAG